MKPHFYSGVIAAKVALVAAGFLAAPAAHAALGQHADSVATDATRLSAIAHASNVQAAYTVHTITLASGTVVREFVSRDGIVFGVAWDGPTLPDLKATLGAAFDRFAAASPTRGRPTRGTRSHRRSRRSESTRPRGGSFSRREFECPSA